MEYDFSSEEKGDSDEHIDVSSTQQQQVILVGGHNKWEWMFLSLAVVSAFSICGSSVILMQECPHPLTLCNHCFLLEMLISTLAGISLVYAFYGIFAERQFVIYLQLMWMAVALFCSWISFTIREGEIHYFRLSVNTSVTVLTLLSIFLAFKATHAPDWIEFRLFGVSDALTAIYKQACCLRAMLMFDSILKVAFAIYSADFVFQLSCDYWCAYQGLMILYTISITVIGKIAIYYEVGYFVYAFLSASACFVLFVIFQMYLLTVNLVNLVSNFPAEREVIIMCSSSFVFALFVVACKVCVMWQMRKIIQSFDSGINTMSFIELVSRISRSLLRENRSSLYS